MTDPLTAHKKGGLTELPATAICGNDITSSCLYVSALAIIQAGNLAWLVLLIVAGVLFLYRKIYAEVVGALPLNGGAYNALLNTTSKRVASFAACLTVLSYMATAVISASEAMHYVHSLWSGLPVIGATIAMLAAFMLLTIAGISESSKVAVVIFVTHIVSLSLLLGAGAVFVYGRGVGVLVENFSTPPPGGVGHALFFGFAAAMLGISGFESSANFVEEQAEGVFPKTLRNMWVAVSVFNPAIALLALALVRIPEVEGNKEALLSHLGSVAGGDWLAALISIDAALVLAGAVLTSFVGVTGLLRRMALDRCLPQTLLKTNRRGTSHRIIVLFFLLSTSVLLITRGELSALAGVYTISFLMVMALFGVGSILLKVRRARLRRPSRASWATVLLATVAVLIGLTGNVLINPLYVEYFLFYFVPTLLAVLFMLGRIGILKALLFFVAKAGETVAGWSSRTLGKIRSKIEEINSLQIVFFSRGDSVATLNQAMLYVHRNEHSNSIKVVTVGQSEAEVPARLKSDLELLDEVYPEIDIAFVFVKGTFGPELIDRMSREWDIPKNFMFIGSPGDHFLYGLAELGGVRLII